MNNNNRPARPLQESTRQKFLEIKNAIDSVEDKDAPIVNLANKFGMKPDNFNYRMKIVLNLNKIEFTRTYTESRKDYFSILCELCNMEYYLTLETIFSKEKYIRMAIRRAIEQDQINKKITNLDNGLNSYFQLDETNNNFSELYNNGNNNISHHYAQSNLNVNENTLQENLSTIEQDQYQITLDNDGFLNFQDDLTSFISEVGNKTIPQYLRFPSNQNKDMLPQPEQGMYVGNVSPRMSYQNNYENFGLFKTISSFKNSGSAHPNQTFNSFTENNRRFDSISSHL